MEEDQVRWEDKDHAGRNRGRRHGSREDSGVRLDQRGSKQDIPPPFVASSRLATEAESDVLSLSDAASLARFVLRRYTS